MAKLYLKFEANILKEVNIGQKDVVTIGRLPDNTLQIDNLAVSGHHARVFWDADHFAIEDNQSLNGTYVNNQRITKHALKDNDSVLIGKHNIVFKDEWHEDTPSTAPASKAKAMPALPKMESTVVLDTKKAKEMLAAARAAAAGGPPPAEAAPASAQAEGSVHQPATAATPAPHAAMPKQRVGTLTVLEGKTNEPHYVLSSKLTVIGGSKMATVKIKGSWWRPAPDVAAMINRGEDAYHIAPQGTKANVRINGTPVAHRQELKEGDMLEIGKVKMSFGFSE